MSISGISSASQSGGAQGVQGGHHHRRPSPDELLAKLQNDDTDEGKALKSAIEKMQSDIQSGTAGDDTLKADRTAFMTAMKAYREKDGGPQGVGGASRPEGPPPRPIDNLASRLESDDSDEATALKSALEKFRTDTGSDTSADATTVRNDKDALKSAFETYLEKLHNEQDTQTARTPLTGQGGWNDDGRFSQACRGGRSIASGSFFNASA